jgi:translation initiation factor IF-3
MEGRQMVMVLSPRKKEVKLAKPKSGKSEADTDAVPVNNKDSAQS